MNSFLINAGSDIGFKLSVSFSLLVGVKDPRINKLDKIALLGVALAHILFSIRGARSLAWAWLYKITALY